MVNISKKERKLFILCFLALHIAGISWGQVRDADGKKPGNRGADKGGFVSREAYRKKRDSIAAHAITPLVKLWRLEADGAYAVRHYRDTADMNRQILYPNYKKSIANTFLGNVGSANQSMIFALRNPLQEFLFLQPYEYYLSRPETQDFVDTRTPYTELNYSTGGNNNREENILNVFLTRNINKNWNVGVKYNLISSKGQYQNQKHKLYDFTLFSSYETGRYKLYSFLSHNRIKLEENGGLVDDALVERDTTVTSENMQVHINNAGTSLHNQNFFLSHQYNIGEMRKRVLFSDTTKVYPIKIVHTLQFDESSRKYSDAENSTSFYKTFLYAYGSKISEKTKYRNFKNTAQIVLNEGYFNWFKYGLRAALQYEKIKYEIPDLAASFPLNAELSSTSQNQNNIAAEVGAFFSSTEKTNWAASWKTYISGYHSGDMIAKAHYVRYLGKDTLYNHKLRLEFRMTNKTPSLLWNQYFSNHIYWNNNFDKETHLKVGGYYKNKAWKVEVGGYWQALSNYTYFDSKALPAQADTEISVITAYAKKDFRLWKLHFEPTVYFQKSSNENILPLSTLSIYGNTYFEGDLFKKALTLRVGADARYNTKWHAPAYMPATSQYYLQTEKELGGYPKIDVYLVARIKRAAFFAKYEHLNQIIGNKGYFSALHYPITPGIFKYGVRWYFYD